jgi:3-hydroxyacyl-CoA dehydrogenase
MPRSARSTPNSTSCIDQDTVNRLRELLSGTTDLGEYADCDLVIEAVFEDLTVKHQVLAAVEQIVRPDAVLATNTSSLSVEQIAAPLNHPQRVVGFHFFNPVAVMPLIEIVRTPHTDNASLATAFALAAALGKTAVLTGDSPGFVVNRLLAIVMGEAAHAVDRGTPLTTVESAFTPLGLPMTPYQLIDLVGWKVAAHVLDTMAAAFPDRFHRSDNLHRLAEHGPVLDRDPAGRIVGWSAAAGPHLQVGTDPIAAEEILRRVQDALATEIRLMLADGVVADAQDIDLCMILGAGWPQRGGGITPYLDRTGTATRILGDTFHHPPITGHGPTTAAPPVPTGAAS